MDTLEAAFDKWYAAYVGVLNRPEVRFAFMAGRASVNTEEQVEVPKQVYNVNMNVRVEAENICDAIALATDMAAVDSEAVTVVSVMVTGDDGVSKFVQYGADT